MTWEEGLPQREQQIEHEDKIAESSFLWGIISFHLAECRLPDFILLPTSIAAYHHHHHLQDPIDYALPALAFAQTTLSKLSLTGALQLNTVACVCTYGLGNNA